jgi:hypothetical protein
MRSLPTKRQSAIDLAQKLRLIRLRDLEAHELPRAYLFPLSQEGSLQAEPMREDQEYAGYIRQHSCVGYFRQKLAAGYIRRYNVGDLRLS